MILDQGFLEFITKNNSNHLSFLTLGDEGTSSFHAAKKLAEKYPAEIKLYPTYEEAANQLKLNPNHSLLIVANAYAQINLFYISDDLYPIGAFFYGTPPYVIAANNLDALNQNYNIRIATHPAPKHLIFSKYEARFLDIIEVESTYKAAEMCYNNECQACLTTQKIADQFNLITITEVMSSIPMLWTIFTSK